MRASLQTVMRFASIFSMAGSISILIRYFRHPVLQQKEVNKVICCVAICDFFFSIGTFIGRPNDGTWACWIQSAMTTYFSLVSIFWTTVIAFMLYQLVHHKHSDHVNCFRSIKIHSACWIFPLIMTFAPLSTNTYGNPDADSGWCFLDVRHGHKSWTLNFWLFASYYFWIFSAAFLYVYMLWSIFSRLTQVYQVLSEAQDRYDSKLARKIRSNVLKLSWYPIIIVVCWIPSGVYDLREAFNSNDHDYSSEADYANLLPVMKGFFTAVVFCTTTRISQSMSDSSSPYKNEPSRMGDDSTEDDEDYGEEAGGSGLSALQQSLLHEHYLSTAQADENGDRVSSTSSQSLDHSETASYRDNSDIHRCSLPELKGMTSVDSF